jgi:tryptophan synthase alpha chain
VKKVTTKPVLVGVGVSNPEQAVEASKVADGVIMGAAVVRRMMEGGSEAVGSFIREVRTALDA